MEPSTTIYTIQLDSASQSLIQAFAEGRSARAVAFATPDEFLQSPPVGETGCIVLGFNLSGGPRFDQLTPIVAAGLPVVVVAEQPTIPHTVRAMQLGAAAVLEKPLDRGALEQALHFALEQEARQRSARQRREDVLARLASLTEGEREVLQRLMAGMANKNIAADLQLGLRTVELRRAKILKKLGAKSLAEMVRLVVLADPAYAQQP